MRGKNDQLSADVSERKPNIFRSQMESFGNRSEGTPVAQERSPNIFRAQMESFDQGRQERGIAPPDSTAKSIGRTALQAPLGFLKRWTWPADVFKWGTEGLAKEFLREMAEDNPMMQGEGAKKAQEEGMQSQLKYIHTQSSLEELIEELTGAPLTPQNRLQSALRMGGEAASFRPGGVQGKAIAGVVAPSVSEGMKELGAPEITSDILGFLASGAAPTFSKATRPSGLTPRGFEKLTKSKKVSPARHQKITEAVEGDVRKVTNEILAEHPDYHAIREDPDYKNKLNAGFEKVSELAEGIPDTVKPRQLSSFMKRRANRFRRERKGILSSEAEQTFDKEFQGFIQRVESLPEDMTMKELVDQYRKNNNSLAEFFEPGQSKAFNTGKRDALLEFNRSIEELFETVHPNSEFTKLFREQNKKWTQLMDAEHIEGTLGKIFKDGKIGFNEVSKLLDTSKANLRRPFQRLMGKEGFTKFESLMKDLRSIKDPYSMLKKAESAGFGNMAKTAAAYMMHPKVGKLYTGYKLAKGIGNVLLDKPQLVTNWKSGIEALKKGNYKEAEKQFERLDTEAHRVAEKVRPFERKARTVPEEFANPEKISKGATQAALEKPHYPSFPSPNDIEKWKLNEPIRTISDWDANIFYGGKTPPIPTKIFKNQWNKLMVPEKFESYYSGKNSDFVGNLGSFISNPRVRKMYKDVLHVPVIKLKKSGSIGSYSMENQSIYIGPDLSPAQFYSILIHEGHHALQDLRRSHLLRPPHYTSPEKSKMEYAKSRAERRARLAQRYVTKDIQKMMSTSKKAQVVGHRKTPESSKTKTNA